MAKRYGSWLDKAAVMRAVEDAGKMSLVKCAAEVEREAKMSMKKGGKMIVGGGGRNAKGQFKKQIKRHIPSEPGTPPHRDKGNLVGSIRYAQTETGSYVIGPTMTAFYGRVHEFGARIKMKNGRIIVMPKRPFMRPALMNTKNRFPDFFKNLPLANTPDGRNLNSRGLFG